MQQKKPDVPMLGLNNVTEMHYLYSNKSKAATYSCELCFPNTKIDGCATMYEHLIGIRHMENYLIKHFPDKMIHLKLISQHSAKMTYLHNQAKLLCDDQMKYPQSLFLVNLKELEEEKHAFEAATAAVLALDEAAKAETEALRAAKDEAMKAADEIIKVKPLDDGIIDLTAEEVNSEPFVANLYNMLAGLRDIPLVGLSYITEIQGIAADKVPPRYVCKLCDKGMMTANYINSHITSLDHRLNFLNANYPVFYSKAEGKRDRIEKFCREIEEQFGRESISVKKRLHVRLDGMVVYTDPVVVKASVQLNKRDKEVENDWLETLQKMETIRKMEKAQKQKTEVLRKTEAVQKTEMMQKIETTRKMEEEQNTKAVQKTELVHKTQELVHKMDAVQKVKMLQKTEAIQKMEEVQQMKAVRKTELVHKTQEFHKMDAVRGIDAVQRAEAVQKMDMLQNTEGVRKKEAVQKTKAVRKKEVGHKTQEFHKADVVREIDSVQMAEAVQKTEMLQKTEAMRKMEEVQKTMAVQKKEVVHKRQEFHKTDAVLEIDTVQKVEAVQKTDMLPKTEAMRKMEMVQKTKALRKKKVVLKSQELQKTEVVRKTDVEHKTRVLKKDVLHKTESGCRKMEALHKTEEVQNVESIKKTETLHEMEAVQQMKAAQKTEVMQQTQTLHKPEAMQQMQAVQKTEAMQQMQAVQKTEEMQQTQMLQKTEAMRKMEMVQKTKALRKKKVVLKTQELQKTEVVRKTEVEHKTRVLKKDVLHKTESGCRKMEALHKTEEVQNVESIKKTETLHEMEAVQQMQAAQKTEVMQQTQTLHKPEAIQQMQAVQNTEAMQQMHAVQKTEAKQQTQTFQKTEAMQQTQKLLKKEAMQQTQMLQKTEAMQQTQMLHKTEAMQQMHVVQKTEEIKQMQAVQKTEVMQQTQTLHNTEAMQEIHAVQMTATLHNTKTVQQTQALHKTDTVRKTEPLEKMKALHKIESVQKTEMLHKMEVVQKTEMLHKTDAIEKTETLHKTEMLHVSLDELEDGEDIEDGDKFALEAVQMTETLHNTEADEKTETLHKAEMLHSTELFNIEMLQKIDDISSDELEDEEDSGDIMETVPKFYNTEMLQKMDDVSSDELEEVEDSGEKIVFNKIIEGLECTPMLGLQYIREIQHPTIEVPPMYECDLCNIKNGPYLNTRNILKHICSKEHRLGFIKQNHYHIFHEIHSLKTTELRRIAIDKETKEIESRVSRASVTMVMSSKPIYWTKSDLHSMPLKTEAEEAGTVIPDADQPQWKCTRCNMVVARDRRREHIVAVHIMLFSCSVCQLSFPENQYMQIHKNLVHGEDLPVMKKQLNTEYNMQKWFILLNSKGETEIHDPAGRISVMCKECGTMVKPIKAKEHVNTCHIKGYKCRVCSISYGSNKALEKHSLESHNVIEIVPFVDHTAGMNVSDKFVHVCAMETEVIDLTNLDAAILKYWCKLCQTAYLDRNLAKEHYQKSHNLDYRCTVCKHVFFESKQLENHLRICHQVVCNVKTPAVAFGTCIDVIGIDGTIMSLEAYEKSLQNDVTEPRPSPATSPFPVAQVPAHSVQTSTTKVSVQQKVGQGKDWAVVKATDDCAVANKDAVDDAAVVPACGPPPPPAAAAADDDGKSRLINLAEILAAKEDAMFDWEAEIAKIKERMELGQIISIAKKSKFMMNYTSSVSNYSIIGSQLITEFQQKDIDIEPWYICELCEDRISCSRITAHIASLKHRIRYLEKKHKVLYGKVAERQFESLATMTTVVTALSHGVVKKEGKRFSMKVMIELHPSELNAGASKSTAVPPRVKDTTIGEALESISIKETKSAAVTSHSKQPTSSTTRKRTSPTKLVTKKAEAKTAKESDGKQADTIKKLPAWIKIPRLPSKDGVTDKSLTTHSSSPGNATNQHTKQKAKDENVGGKKTQSSQPRSARHSPRTIYRSRISPERSSMSSRGERSDNIVNTSKDTSKSQKATQPDPPRSSDKELNKIDNRTAMATETNSSTISLSDKHETKSKSVHDKPKKNISKSKGEKLVVVEDSENKINEKNISLEELQLIHKSIEQQIQTDEELNPVEDDTEGHTAVNDIQETILSKNECSIEMSNDFCEELEVKDEIGDPDAMVIEIKPQINVTKITNKTGEKKPEKCVVEVTTDNLCASTESKSKDGKRIVKSDKPVATPGIEIHMNLEQSKPNTLEESKQNESKIADGKVGKNNDSKDNKPSIVMTKVYSTVVVEKETEDKAENVNSSNSKDTAFVEQVSKQRQNEIKQEISNADKRNKSKSAFVKQVSKPELTHVRKNKIATDNEGKSLKLSRRQDMNANNNPVKEMVEAQHERPISPDFDAFIASQLGEGFVTVDDLLDIPTDDNPEKKEESETISKTDEEIKTSEEYAKQNVSNKESKLAEIRGKEKTDLPNHHNVLKVEKSKVHGDVSGKDEQTTEVCHIENNMEPNMITESEDFHVDAGFSFDPYDDSCNMEFVLGDQFITVDEHHDSNANLDVSSVGYEEECEDVVCSIGVPDLHISKMNQSGEQTDKIESVIADVKNADIYVRHVKKDIPVTRESPKNVNEQLTDNVRVMTVSMPGELGNTPVQFKIPDKGFNSDPNLTFTNEEHSPTVLISYGFDEDDDDDIEEIFLGGDFVTVDEHTDKGVEPENEYMEVTDSVTVSEIGRVQVTEDVVPETEALEFVDSVTVPEVEPVQMMEDVVPESESLEVVDSVTVLDNEQTTNDEENMEEIDFNPGDFVTLDEIDLDTFADQNRFTELKQEDKAATIDNTDTTSRDNSGNRDQSSDFSAKNCSSNSSSLQKKTISREDGRSSKDKSYSKKSTHVSSRMRDAARHSSSTKKRNSSQTTQRDSSQTTQRDSSQTPQRDSSQTTQRDSSQTTQRDSSQTTQRDSSQTTQRYSSQTTQRDSSQTPQRDSSQTTQRDSSQTTQRDSSQTTQRDSSQTTQRYSSQMTQRDSSQTTSSHMSTSSHRSHRTSSSTKSGSGRDSVNTLLDTRSTETTKRNVHIESKQSKKKSSTTSRSSRSDDKVQAYTVKRDGKPSSINTCSFLGISILPAPDAAHKVAATKETVKENHDGSSGTAGGIKRNKDNDAKSVSVKAKKSDISKSEEIMKSGQNRNSTNIKVDKPSSSKYPGNKHTPDHVHKSYGLKVNICKSVGSKSDAEKGKQDKEDKGKSRDRRPRGHSENRNRNKHGDRSQSSRGRSENSKHDECEITIEIG